MTHLEDLQKNLSICALAHLSILTAQPSSSTTTPTSSTGNTTMKTVICPGSFPLMKRISTPPLQSTVSSGQASQKAPAVSSLP